MKVGLLGALIHSQRLFLTFVDFFRKSLIDFPQFNYGMTNFDNILFSFISVFEIVIGEGWVDILYIVSEKNLKILINSNF